MPYYVGVDVSMKESFVCILDASDQVQQECTVPSDPKTLACLLGKVSQARSDVQIGLEVGALSPWLFHELTALGFSVTCFEARQVAQILKPMRNKTDRHDAHGLAQILRGGWYQATHVKSYDAHSARALLKARNMLVKARQDLENQLRGLLKPFGARLARGGRHDLAVRVAKACRAIPTLMTACQALLATRATLCDELERLDQEIKAMVQSNPPCQQLMTIPGIGPITALAFMAHLDDPARFTKARSMGACLGLTPRRYQSGEVDYQGRISKRGDKMLRTLLYEAANVLLSVVKRWCPLKAWGLKLAKRSGFKKARIAVARKLAVIMTAMLKDGTDFCWQAEG